MVFLNGGFAGEAYVRGQDRCPRRLELAGRE
jgi:hypothetical protein